MRSDTYERQRDHARFETENERAQREALEELQRRAAAFAESARAFAAWCSEHDFLDRRAIRGGQMTKAEAITLAIDLIEETISESWLNKETRKALEGLDG